MAFYRDCAQSKTFATSSTLLSEALTCKLRSMKKLRRKILQFFLKGTQADARRMLE